MTVVKLLNMWICCALCGGITPSYCWILWTFLFCGSVSGSVYAWNASRPFIISVLILSVFLLFSFLSLLRMFLFCFCCTKLKLHAKEKITEAATDEARLFAPLEQVDLYMVCI